MTLNEDIRWEQRFSNYRKALAQLSKFINKGDLSELEEQGLIKAFEYTYELAWSTLKDYLQYQGISNITGARDTFREALIADLITDGLEWMSMILSRNLTSHSYNQDTADEISDLIKRSYYFLFKKLETKLESLRLDTQNNFH
jgi:nucleotidyltransferase substrate binding protein (TIGR01987 family)